MQIDSIKELIVRSITPQYSAVIASTAIPGGYSSYSLSGLDNPAFDFELAVTGVRAKLRLKQLAELRANPKAGFTYFDCGSEWPEYDGWYVIDALSTPRSIVDTQGCTYQFTLSAHRIATAGSHRQSLYWTSADETTGFSGLTPTAVVGLPVGATNVTITTANRAACDGTVPVVHDPGGNTVMYTASPALGNWYRGECRVYDSATAGDTDEGNWERVYHGSHVFDGDTIIQNGILRYKLDANGRGTFYVWDNVSATPAWLSIGQLRTAFSGNADAAVKFVELTRLTAEEVRWREVRMNGAALLTINYALRRGSYFCRVELETRSSVIDDKTYVRLYSGADGTAYFDTHFNDADSKAAGAGDCAVSATSNYGAGYKTTRNCIAGFGYLLSPDGQPADAANHSLAMGDTWDIEETIAFAVFGFPFATSGLPGTIATARTTCDLIGREALKNVEVEPCLEPKAWHV